MISSASPESRTDAVHEQRSVGRAGHTTRPSRTALDTRRASCTNALDRIVAAAPAAAALTRAHLTTARPEGLR